MATDWRYLPILKWKQGERIALRELSDAQWTDMVPVLELPAIEGELRPALGAYLDKIVGHFKSTFPEDKSIGVDIRFVAPSYAKQAKLLATICARLERDAERTIIPVIADSMMDDDEADLELLSAFDECILRIQTPMVDPVQIPSYVRILTGAGIGKRTLHLLVDQYSIVREDAARKFTEVKDFLDAALAVGCASVTVGGGSFPMNLTGFKQGLYSIPRVEWEVWQRVKQVGAYAAVRYSDYAVTNPAPLPNLDPTEINPSVAIRYAADGEWKLFKAGGFKNGKPNQYQGLCNLLLRDAAYSGATFSFGDGCYAKAAAGKLGGGNPSSWRRDATSHHLVLTASSL